MVWVYSEPGSKEPGSNLAYRTSILEVAPILDYSSIAFRLVLNDEQLMGDKGNEFRIGRCQPAFTTHDNRGC